MTTTRELLGPAGPLARAMRGYEHRGGQLDMADAVERALREDRVLLCEAGTGTGKTLAYLVPALRSGRRVVVSTATKALQEQIFFKDLPLVERHLDVQVDAALVKGLGNYVCLRRLREVCDGTSLELALEQTEGSGYDDVLPEAAQPGRKRRAGKPRRGQVTRSRRAGGPFGPAPHRPSVSNREALSLVQLWALETQTGDISELRALPEDHPLWPEITASSDTRLGAECSHYEDCFITRLRRAADRAQLLVVNHHLLFADLAIRGDHPGGVLPPYDAVVLDEAHRIEDIATSFFGAQVSTTLLERLGRDAERAMRGSGLHLDPVRPPPLVEGVRHTAQALFASVAHAASSTEGREPLRAELWTGELRDRYHALDDALDALVALATAHDEHEPLRAVAGRAQAVRGALERIVQPARAQVTWYERRARSMGLAASPIDVGPILRDRLFGCGKAVVLTSASLSTGRGFDFVRSRLGLSELPDVPIDELVVASALDHHANALLYTPTDLPEVTEAAFGAAAIERTVELVALADGGVFVLCTSVRSMSAIAEALGARIRHPVLVQGQAPKRALLESFRTLGNAVLVATMSFWEGVDVPGQALRLVIIDRIPFAVPTDPIVAARCHALEEAGQQPFAAYSLPQAAITLKQGFGRLLRTRDDWGAVAILDRRICLRGYGRLLLEGLPPVHQTTELAALEAFWAARLATMRAAQAVTLPYSAELAQP